MPILGQNLEDKPVIELMEGIDLAAIQCIRNMPEIYQHPSKAIGYRVKWRLFVTSFEKDMPEVLIYDDGGYITKGHSKYALVPQTNTVWIQNWLLEVPEDIQEKMKSIVRKHGLPDNEESFGKSLTKVLMTTIPLLKNPKTVAKMNDEQWQGFLISCISPGAEKDHRLNLVFKSHLIKGTVQRYNPHTLLFTNSGTGKTTFYDIAGDRIDKTTANRLIGYTTDKPHPGVIDNLNTALCIEQIESQHAPEILAFLLNFMETGTARSETGQEGIVLHGNCPIIITANPTGYTVGRIDSFRALVDHLSGNLMALGRRFGIIVFGTDYKLAVVIKATSEDEWKQNILKFRSIVDYVQQQITDLYKDQEILKWLETPNEEYQKTGNELTKKIQDSEVKEMLLTHFESAFPHIKGASLCCAIVDFLPRLVKEKSDGKKDDLIPYEILERTKAYLNKFERINLESVANMTHLEKDLSELIYKQLPKYAQELILAVSNLRVKYQQSSITLPREFPFGTLDGYMQRINYDYISQIENQFNQHPDKLTENNHYFEKYWHFRVKQKEKHVFAIEFLK